MQVRLERNTASYLVTVLINIISRFLAPCKVIQDSLGMDSTPWILDSRYWITVFVSGFWILDSGFWMLDSNRQRDFGLLELYSKVQDSGFHKQNFPGFQILQSLIPESGFPHIQRRFQNFFSKARNQTCRDNTSRFTFIPSAATSVLFRPLVDLYPLLF